MESDVNKLEKMLLQQVELLGSDNLADAEKAKLMIERSLAYNTKYAEDSSLEDMLRRPQAFMEGAIAGLVQLLRQKAYRDGYIDGATEKGIVWHDLRKNPQDLPESGKWILCKGNAEYFDPYFVAMTDEVNDNEVFLVGYESDDTNGFEDVIAWAEIPQFKE